MRTAAIAVAAWLFPTFGLPGWCPAIAASHSSSAASAVCGWIGAGVGPVPKSFAESLGMDVGYGAVFKAPLPGSPAARAGIEAGDVLTSINGSPLRNWADFKGTIAAFAPGDTIHLWLSRNGQLLDVTLTVDGRKCRAQSGRRAISSWFPVAELSASHARCLLRTSPIARWN